MKTPHGAIHDLKKQISQTIIGQEYVIERLLLGLLCNGNILMEGLPGSEVIIITTLLFMRSGKYRLSSKCMSKYWLPP